MRRAEGSHTQVKSLRSVVILWFVVHSGLDCRLEVHSLGRGGRHHPPLGTLCDESVTFQASRCEEIVTVSHCCATLFSMLCSRLSTHICTTALTLLSPPCHFCKCACAISLSITLNIFGCTARKCSRRMLHLWIEQNADSGNQLFRITAGTGGTRAPNAELCIWSLLALSDGTLVCAQHSS